VFTALFLALFIGAWAVCGAGAWLGLAVATRGHAGLAMLPVAMAAGVVGGLAVPLLARDDVAGLWASLVASVLLPGALLGARALARSATRPDHPSRTISPGREP